MEQLIRYDSCIICKGEIECRSYFFNFCKDCMKYFDDPEKKGEGIQGLMYLGALSKHDIIEVKEIIMKNNDTDAQREIRLYIIDSFNDWCDGRREIEEERRKRKDAHKSDSK